jgi:hypothetical protein
MVPLRIENVLPSQDRPAASGWRLWAGLSACLLWTTLVGLPLGLFHLGQISDYGGILIDQVHATVLFVAAEALIFWLFARPVPLHKQAFAAGQRCAAEEVFTAELVPEKNIGSHQVYPREVWLPSPDEARWNSTN